MADERDGGPGLSPDDPRDVAAWLVAEAGRLKAAADDAEAWHGRVCATDPSEENRLVAADQRDAAFKAWWWHTEELAPSVLRHLDRLAERRRWDVARGMPRAWQD